MPSDFGQRLEQTAKRLGLKSEHIPRHIAIIMDGNGRWAQARGLPRVEGHRQGGRTVEKIAQHCVDIGIEFLTLYSFSIENWKRPNVEIDTLMYLYTRYLVEIRPTLMANNVRLAHLGRLEPLPPSVRSALLDSAKMTASNTGMTLALALNYSGRAEIIDATRKIAQEYKDGKISLEDIDEQCISRMLYTAGLPEPDLLIRTANERRISNFLLWQLSYSELYFTATYWPDFGEAQLDEAIADYARRTRRFGGIE